MGRYEKLGVMAVRWTAIGFFVLAIVLVPLGMVGGGMMMRMMGTAPSGMMMGPGTTSGAAPAIMTGAAAGMMSGAGASMMQGARESLPGARSLARFTTLWWGVLVNVVMGAFLFALSKPLGSLIAGGMDAEPERSD